MLADLGVGGGSDSSARCRSLKYLAAIFSPKNGRQFNAPSSAEEGGMQRSDTTAQASQ